MNKMLLFSVLVALISVAKTAPITCPNLEILQPCSCKRVAYGLQIKCANFNDDDSLVRVFNILRDYNVHTVLMHNLYIEETLPSRLFDGLNIKEIKVEKSELRFDQPAFAGLDSSLHILNVAQDSMIKSNVSFSLAKLTKLNELYVQSNHIQQVSDVWLNDKVPNVNTVVLDYNDINDIQDHAFAGLPLLKHISLADNRIKTVKRSMFPQPATHLTRIDLSFNDIDGLPSDFFSGMPNLREVILSGNELKAIEQLTWTPVWLQLKQVLLFENQLECDEKMYWIRNYRAPYQFGGNCVSPKSMSGRSVKDIFTAT